MRKVIGIFLTLFMVLTVAGCGNSKQDEQVLNIYSSRHYKVDKELYKEFTDKTGIKVNVVEGKSDALIQRILREKSTPAADLFLTVGAESITLLHDDDLIQAYDSETIKNNIPDNFRGKDWMGIVARARVVAYAKDKVDPNKIKTYDDLTKPEWKNQILVRSSNSSYNQGLLASFISLSGQKKAESWAGGIVENFAREPKGNDKDQAKAVAAGVGNLAIINSYYYAQMATSSDSQVKQVTEKVGLIFPQDSHMNISYGAVLQNAKHKDNAVKFLEFLSDKATQEKIVNMNGEFPLNPDAQLSEIQKSWGKFTIQKLDYAKFGAQKPKAIEIFDVVGWK